MKAQLPPSLVGKYEIVGSHANHIDTHFGVIRFSSLTEARCEQLLNKGCPFIQRAPQLLEDKFEALITQTEVAEPEQVAEKPKKALKKSTKVEE